MSGHSKWHSIRHKKALIDAKRGKVLTRHSKLITIAGRNNPSPENNPALRHAIINAKSDGVPKDNIDRVLKKLSGADKNQSEWQTLIYEGFGPGGVPFLVQVITDNPNRSWPEVRTVFDKNGGQVANAGAVKFLFKPVGLIRVAKGAASLDDWLELALEWPILDVQESSDEEVLIVTEFADFGKVRDGLESAQKTIQSANVSQLIQAPVVVSASDWEKVERLWQRLEELEDVDEVFVGAQDPTAEASE